MNAPRTIKHGEYVDPYFVKDLQKDIASMQAVIEGDASLIYELRESLAMAQRDLELIGSDRNALRAENKRLREALKTIEGHVSAIATHMISGGDFVKTGTCLLQDVCEPARAALAGKE